MAKMNRAAFESLLEQWEQSKKTLDAAKEDEMRLRKEIAHSGWMDEKEGANKLELNNGYELKSVIKYNYKLDDDHNKVIAVSDKLPPHVSDRLFKWKVDLSLSEYRILDPAHKKLVDRVLTITEGAPSLEIKAPKSAK